MKFLCSKFRYKHDIQFCLGRGGSDGCKVPMKVEALQGLGVVKVECGSQFSVALTDTGVVYTW